MKRKKKDVIINVAYHEVQLVGDTPEEEHFVLWAQDDKGRWYGLVLPPGEYFNQ